MTVFLVPNLKKDRCLPVTQQCIAVLRTLQATIYMEEKNSSVFPHEGVQFVSFCSALPHCDAVLTIGGDGTMLHTARKCFGENVPLLGINLGRTGFLATVEPNELDEKLLRLAQKQYTLDQRGILNVCVQGEECFTQQALNDVVIAKTSIAHTIDVQVFCDDILVNHYQGDGVIVATPTGSTAYSLSAGGPILDARIFGIVVTPICAHSLQAPSMVFSAQRKMRIHISSPVAGKALISCDGRGETPISYHDEITIAFCNDYISLVSFNEADQFHAIDKKLKGR